jgi:hypothetical protein
MSRSLVKSSLATALLIWASQAARADYTNVVLSGNPLFYWNFNEAGDTAPAADSVGSEAGDALQAEGNATRVTSGSTLGGLSLGRAASFDGTQFSKFFSGTLNGATPPDAWAVEMWVRPQGPDPGDRFQYLLEARSPGFNNVPGILFDYGNNDKVEVFHGARTGPAGPALVNDAWQHLVIGDFGAANDRVDFFLNGVAAGSAVYTGDSAFGTTQIAVGNSVPGAAAFDHFAGQIDELAVYDLTGQSIAAISAKLSSLASHYGTAAPEPAGGLLLTVAASALLSVRRRVG